MINEDSQELEILGSKKWPSDQNGYRKKILSFSWNYLTKQRKNQIEIRIDVNQKSEASVAVERITRIRLASVELKKDWLMTANAS